MARRIILLVLIVLVGAVPAWADVAALSYTDTANQVRTVAPSQQYINPTGSLEVYLTGGLDRKVGYVLQDSGGRTVAEGVSGLITGADTFTVLGQTYYGKVLTVPSALAEGNYTLTGRILDNAGNVVASQNVALVVDRTPPVAGDLWWLARPGVLAATSIMHNELVTNYDVRQIWVKDVSDANGIAAVQFESYDPPTGSVYGSRSGWYNAGSREAGIGNSAAILSGLPSLDGPLGVRFILTDPAGNRAVAAAVVRYDGSCAPHPELIAIHDPSVTAEYPAGTGLTGYVPYVPGMAVYENPLQLLYRLPRSNWLAENPDYGLTASGGVLAATDAQYAYFVFTCPYSADGTLNASSWRFHNPRWWAAGTLSYNLVLSASAPVSPVLVSYQVYRTDTGWTPLVGATATTDIFLTDAATRVTQLRAVVEPRPYDQVLTFSYPGNISPCTIPAGETECIAALAFEPPLGAQYAYISRFLRVQNPAATLYNTSMTNLKVIYDLAPPVITAYNLEAAAKKVSFLVTKPNSGAVSNYIRLMGGRLVAVNHATGQEVQLSGAVTALGGDVSQVEVHFSSLPEGDWQFTAQAWDMANNLASLDLGRTVLDATPPAVQVYRAGLAFSDHSVLGSLDQLSFTVTDGVDQHPVVESVRLTGGPQNTEVYLAYRHQNGAYVLEYPVLYPSGGQEYALAVTARDASGNRRTQTVSFAYNPPTIQLTSSGQGSLNLPAIPASVVHVDGGNALVSQPVQLDGSPISGVYDLVVMSGTDSTSTVVVNNVTVAPGEQKTLLAYDFGAQGGRLNLPIWSSQAGRVNLLVTSAAPNFPVLVVPVQFWQPQVQLTANPGWEVQPLIQAQKINFAPGGETPCRLTFDEREARSADPVDNPACLVEITAKPSGYRLQDGVLQGVLQADDPLTLEYQVSLFNAGARYVLGTGSRAITRVPITDVAVSVQASESPVYRKVQEVSVQARSAGRLPCRVTGDRAEAQRYGEYELACLVRWQAVPAGLEADVSLPVLSGRVAGLGDQVVSWSVDVYAPAGHAAGVSSGAATITAMEPPEPIFALQPGLYTQAVDEGNIIVTAEANGDVGSVQFKPPMDNAAMTMTVTVDGEQASYVYQPLRAITFSRYLKLGPLPVWSTKDVQVTLSYRELPEKKAERSYRVTVVPPKRLEAWLTADRVGSSTTGLGVSLQVGSRGRDGFVYDKSLNGEWEVEFGYLEGVADYHAMTARELLPDSGALPKTLNPPLGNVKLVAVLNMKPPESASFYTRTLVSNKAYAQVMKGEAPAGELSSTVVSGPAPLVVMPKLKVGSEDQKVLGGISWQISRDNGSIWEELAGVQPYMAQLKLEPGQYLVRVELANRLSQARGYSNQLAFTAYEVPEVVVSGPTSVIVNTPLTIQAALATKGQAVAAAEATIQWYRHDRGGDTLVHTGPSYTVTHREMGNYQYIVRASLKNAVATDAKAWRQAVKIVRVMAPAAPEIRLTGPTSMEYNTKEAQTYRLQAVAALRSGLDLAAYPVEGEWELPDGTVVQGAELSYSPTAADAAKRKSLIVYRAWISGMKESTTATVLKSIPLTIYEWPTFSINADLDYSLAPTLATLTVMPSTGKPWTLERPQYAWSLPEGATVVKSMDNGRIVQAIFREAGSHTVSVDIQDARGSRARAAAPVELAAAPPFEVSFQPLYSNADKREPLDVLVRARFSGGHPADRITAVTYSTETPGAAVNQSLGQVQNLLAGNHTITVAAATKFGQVVEATLPVEVAVNQPPTCTVTSRQDARYVYLEAECRDPDGRITAYRWYRHGRVVGCSNRLTHSHADAAEAVLFEATDNNGARYRETITYNTGG